jgi:hypothetical protein
VWFEDAEDGQGSIGRNTKTWEKCTVLDTQNWRCEAGWLGSEKIPDDIEMKDGQLTQEYWGEHRQFSMRRRLRQF